MMVIGFWYNSDLYSNDSNVYQISSSTMEILIHFILYVAMTTHDTLYIMPIHGHCNFMYLGMLHVFAVKHFDKYNSFPTIYVITC